MNALFSEDLINGCIATTADITIVKKYGSKFVIESPDGKLTGYEWNGKVYITDLIIYPL